LITHQRRVREPGDSAEMLQQRRSFLDAGWYAPLADSLAGFARDGASVLDAGCGEGYYTRDWPARADRLSLWAIDIAKPAVRMAARRSVAPPPKAAYAVASVYDLPVLDASIDVVVSVFAPLHSPEFERVLRRGGVVVTVTPGPDHLAGLKALLFAEPEAHPSTGPFEREGAMTRLVPAGLQRLRYEVEVPGPDQIAALLGMTPYAWYVDAATRQAVADRPSLATTVDFVVATYALA